METLIECPQALIIIKQLMIEARVDLQQHELELKQLLARSKIIQVYCQRLNTTNDLQTLTACKIKRNKGVNKQSGRVSLQV